MARISTYPLKVPTLQDKLLGSATGLATNNFSIGSILDLTGLDVGTDYTLAMFGPGSTLADSIIVQNAAGTSISIGTDDTQEVTTEATLSIQGPVKDSAGTLGGNEQVLVSNAGGYMAWENYQGSGLEYQAAWDASTDIPDLTAIVLDDTNTGKYWVVSTAGATNLGGITDWNPGDWAIVSQNDAGTVFWDKIDNSGVDGIGVTNQITVWTSATTLGFAPIKLGSGTNSFIYNDLTNNLASGSNSNAFGSNTEASGGFSTAMGQQTVASGNNSTAMGLDNVASGGVSSAFGFNNTVSGYRSGALGANNIVAGAQTWVTGEGNDVGVSLGGNGDNIIVSGQGNTVRSGTSGVIGKDNNVTSSTSTSKNFILGYSNALNEVSDSIAIGGSNTISADRGYAFGESNTTSSSDTYAIGKNNTLSSEDDYAFGFNNTISGSASIAMALGHNNILSGSQSYAFGRDLVDGGEDNTIIIGRYNTVPTATGRIVFGTGFSNAGRKNAIEIQAGTSAQSGILFPAVRLSNSYNNNLEALQGGVEEGELYRADNQIRILTGTSGSAKNNEGLNFLSPDILSLSNTQSKNFKQDWNITLAKWSGAVGNASLTLPNITSETNRVLKVITDSAFSGSTLTILTSGGTSTINGQANLVLTGAYQSVSLWTDGTEWYILN